MLSNVTEERCEEKSRLQNLQRPIITRAIKKSSTGDLTFFWGTVIWGVFNPTSVREPGKDGAFSIWQPKASYQSKRSQDSLGIQLKHWLPKWQKREKNERELRHCHIYTRKAIQKQKYYTSIRNQKRKHPLEYNYILPLLF